MPDSFGKSDMNVNDQIKFWENALQQEEDRYKSVPASMREIAYWRDVVPYRRNVRRARESAGIPICRCATDCLAYPNSKCAKGHLTCDIHRGDCFLCKTG